MILTTHILSGALIGAEIKNPFYVAVVSVIVHFLLDLFPHGDYLNKKSTWRDGWKTVTDLAFGFTLLAAAIFIRGETSNNGLYIMNIGIGVLFSLLPDGITLFYWKMGMKFLRPVYDFHQKLHRAPDFSPEREFRLKNNLWDIFISLISLIILISLR